MSSVLYDVPGPRAQIRNRLLGVLTVVIVAVLLAYLLWRLWVTGQLAPGKWEAFTYPNVWRSIGEAVIATATAFLVAAVGAFVVGLTLAIGTLSDHRPVRILFAGLVDGVRAVPVLVLMIMLYYGLPTLGLRMTPFEAVVISLGLGHGAVLAEIIRAGVQALPRGQSEAGYAIGLRKSGVLRLILLPQALRSMAPSIVAQMMVVLKDTALGFIITYPELLYYARYLGSQASLQSPIIPATIVIGTVYILLCMGLSLVASLLQRRRRTSRRRPKSGVAAGLSRDITLTETIAIRSRRPARRSKA